MITYTYVDGLMADERYCFTVPAHLCLVRPNGRSVKFPRVSLQVLSLNVKGLHSALLDDGCSEWMADFFVKEMNPRKDIATEMDHVFLKVETSDYNLDEQFISLSFITALRFYTGACVSDSSFCQFPSATQLKSRKLLHKQELCSPRQLLSHFKGYVFSPEIADGFGKFIEKFVYLYEYLLAKKDLNIAFRYLSRTFDYLGDVPMEDKILFLTIALESLFSPSGKDELKYRVSQNASVFLGVDELDRERVFRVVRLAYDVRSAVAHGSFISFGRYKGRRKLEEFGDVSEFVHLVRHYVRESIVRRMILKSLDCGYSSKDDVITSLEKYCHHASSRISELPEEYVTISVESVLRGA